MNDTIYGFDTDNKERATAAYCVYVLWRSRGQGLKITPKIWGQVEGWVKSSAKRAESLGQFIERMKPRLQVHTLNPKWMEVGARGIIKIENSAGGLELFEPSEQREFMLRVFHEVDERAVLKRMQNETALTVLYVRDRLEREKSIEKRIKINDED